MATWETTNRLFVCPFWINQAHKDNICGNTWSSGNYTYTTFHVLVDVLKLGKQHVSGYNVR